MTLTLIHRLKNMAITATVGAVLSLITAVPAHATAIIATSVDGGGTVTWCSASSLAGCLFNGTVGGVFAINNGGSVYDNTAPLSDALSSVTSVVLLSAGTHTLSISVSSQDFTLPGGAQLKVESSAGGSLGAGSGSFTFQAYADAANALCCSGTFNSYTNGLQMGVFNVSSFDTGSATGSFLRGAGPYSVTTVANITLTGQGSRLNYAGHETVTPIPEPASLFLLGIGLVLGAHRFRKRQRRS